MKNNNNIITLLTLILFIVSFISLFVIDYSIGKNRSIADIIFLMSPVIYLFIFPFICPAMKSHNHQIKTF